MEKEGLAAHASGGGRHHTLSLLFFFFSFFLIELWPRGGEKDPGEFLLPCWGHKGGEGNKIYPWLIWENEGGRGSEAGYYWERGGGRGGGVRIFLHEIYATCVQKVKERERNLDFLSQDLRKKTVKYKGKIIIGFFRAGNPLLVFFLLVARSSRSIGCGKWRDNPPKDYNVGPG